VITCHRSHATCYRSHATCHRSHETCNRSHAPCQLNVCKLHKATETHCYII